MTDYEMPKPVDMYVAEITGRGRSTRTGRKIGRTIKLWPSLLFEIDALAHNTGANRNETMNKLLEVGIDAVRDQLTQEEREKLLTLPAELANKLRQAVDDSDEEAA